ncbi:MAG: hypothetical protein IPO45_00515 [Saprospiraceae bacterium]|jgi:hypothetical protein|uniref:hypothetical protein n=1 Tax=Candidatus Brachybacter algidus TaxID=2982024 RepID=UPI001B407807|nr:hypothetical protein [Candidatus Brachybacter algidus]MBP7306192.1 hypothetical protein [Saprospiraceae bacterium]MBK6375271.1 hypothetical protein [Candidatus Brachybacter algidus]MBK6449635.1 hypothetical protein [Candidatus Brachybacter algidus]MBK7604478.1 hypothetical protein [Candidatus Brachybacter algidus]MBK8842051.1 hypothetical protein [Candidatus Brachybacter algidus]
MNSNKYIYLLFILSFIVSCKQNPKQEEQNVDVPKEIVRSIDCFKYLHKKDTVYMKTITQDSVVTGTLTYSFDGKDKNTGEIEGRMVADILLLDYKFMSEGKESIREVAFKKVGDSYIEGYGESAEEDGKMVFKNIYDLDFSGKMSLDLVNCE